MAKHNDLERMRYSEILSLAIEAVTTKLAPYEEKLGVADTDELRSLIERMIEPLKAKQRSLLRLYYIETGTEYGLEID